MVEEVVAQEVLDQEVRDAVGVGDLSGLGGWVGGWMDE